MPKKRKQSSVLSIEGFVSWARQYARWFMLGFASFVVLTILTIFLLLVGIWKLIVRPVANWVPETVQSIQNDSGKIQQLENKIQKLEERLATPAPTKK